MSKYIDADLLFETIQRRVSNSAIRSWLGAIINELPPVEVETEKHGKWIFKRKYYEAIERNCSECGQRMTTHIKKKAMNFCPNCGARMDVTENET